jgi:hypothetical protein
MNADIATAFLVWLVTFSGGMFTSLAVAQAVTGRRLYPLNPKQTEWSVGELKLLGLCWAMYWLALAAYGLVGGILNAMNMKVPSSFVFWIPFVLSAPLMTILLERRHNRRWPFKEQTSRS